ncbi:hypothetical protein D9M68_612050 [compost metagenome]
MADSFDDRVEATTRLLLETCRQREMRLSGDLAVSENDAADLLGYASGDALRKQVSESVCRIPYRLLGNRRLYRIRDLAAEIERTYG